MNNIGHNYGDLSQGFAGKGLPGGTFHGASIYHETPGKPEEFKPGEQQMVKDDRAAASDSILDLCTFKERERNAQKLREELSHTRGGWASPGKPEPCQAGMVLIEHVQNDPLVISAARRLEKSKRYVDSAPAALAGGRNALFNFEPDHTAKLRRKTHDILMSSLAIGGAGTAGGLIVGASMLLGPQAGVLGFLLTALSAITVVGAQPSMKDSRDLIVEHFLRQKVTTEVKKQSREISGLKAALDTTQGAALKHYEHYLVVNPPTQVSSGQNPEGFTEDNDCISIDGITLMKNRSHE